MGMTNMEKLAKAEILAILSDQGYPTYAGLLSKFDINLTSDPGVVAYMEPNKGRIVFNSGLDIDQVCFIARHEILHSYLQHEQRLLQKLAKDSNLDYDVLEDQDIEELKNALYSNDIFNIAADYEISNRGYTDIDKNTARAIILNGQTISGLVTEDDHPDWVDLSVEDMYDKLNKLRNQDKKSNKTDEINGILMDPTTFIDINGVMYGI